MLKVPHHGSARQDPAFFAATEARVAIASAGADNDYGHPAPRTVQLVRSLGMTVLRTDQQGAVAVTVRDGRIGAVSQRDLTRATLSQRHATGKCSGPRRVVPGRIVIGPLRRIAREAFGQGAERLGQLHPGQRRAEAVVDAAGEGEVLDRRLPGDVETVRIRDRPRDPGWRRPAA